jgi:hypothetical protein
MVKSKLKIQEVAKLVCGNCSQTIDEVTTAGISHGICHKILSDDLNMSHVTLQNVPLILMQNQHDSHMSS